jgi:hypothetical protein
MNENDRSALSDENMLFTLLTAIVKKLDGEIRISEDEMDGVSKSDMLMMYYSKLTKEVILRTHFPEGTIVNPDVDYDILPSNK